MDLHAEPITPDYLIDPDNKTSLAKMEKDVYERAMWEEITAAAKFRAELDKKPYDRIAFVDSLTRDEIHVFEDKATIASLVISSKIQSLADRVSMQFAYKALRRNMHQTQGEYSSFLVFLQEKLDDSPSASSASEVKFLLELLQSFESAGKKGIAQKLFANKVAYGKMVAAIPTLRRKQFALVGAKNNFEDATKGIEKKQETLRTEKSDARVRGEPLKEYDTELKRLDKEKESIEAQSSNVVRRLSLDLTANTAAALELAGSSVSRDMIPQSLPKVAQVYLKRDGLVPEEISSDYGASVPDKSKPIAQAIHLDHKVIYVLEVPARTNKLATKFLAEMFDVQLAELDESIKFLNSFKKRGANS